MAERERERKRARESARERGRERERERERERARIWARKRSLSCSRQFESVKSRACEQSNLLGGGALCVDKCNETKATLGDKLAVSTSLEGSSTASCRTASDEDKSDEDK